MFCQDDQLDGANERCFFFVNWGDVIDVLIKGDRSFHISPLQLVIPTSDIYLVNVKSPG